MSFQVGNNHNQKLNLACQRRVRSAAQWPPGLGCPQVSKFQKSTLAMLDQESLSNLSRKEIQVLAKEHGIKANLKTEEIIDKILRKLETGTFTPGHSLQASPSSNISKSIPQSQRSSRSSRLGSSAKHTICEDGQSSPVHATKFQECGTAEKTSLHTEFERRLSERKEEECANSVDNLILSEDQPVLKSPDGLVYPIDATASTKTRSGRKRPSTHGSVSTDSDDKQESAIFSTDSSFIQDFGTVHVSEHDHDSVVQDKNLLNIPVITEIFKEQSSEVDPVDELSGQQVKISTS